MDTIPTTLPFDDGDTVVFFGDSLTHGGRYIKYITDFYRTRYPGRRIRFVNSGIGGDTAGGAMNRIPEDIAEYDPTWVVFHFGMNDVGRWAYNDESSPETLKTRAGAYEAYCRNLDSIVRKVAEAAPRAKFIYMTPTVYDDTAIPLDLPADANGWAAVNQKGCSVGLSMMAGHVLSKAERDNALGVDLYSPMQNCLMKRRAVGDMHFMLTRWDRVHPEEPGHSIMAWTFLKAQGVDPIVSDVAVDAVTRSVSRNVNADVSDIAPIEGGIAFTVLERALPCPVDAKAAPFADEFDFAETLNREMLSVSGLAPGKYAVLIDGRQVGEWTAGELDQGVNLAMAATTPQAAQAAAVFGANERNRETEYVLRNHHSGRWAYFGQTDVDDVDAFAKWFAGRNETGYFAQFVPGYLEYWPHYKETRAALLAEQEKVFALANPKPHRYEIATLLQPRS
ncbi:MAG: SGNH/GDSL hydrolase family protein [Kiritimatiellae bacterium]|nr:SGNH/GDSL hydrolase family protein [Kiritimatiellia bacterium]